MDLTALTFYHGSAAESVTPTFGLGDDRRPVPYGDYNAKYNERDKQARDRMDQLISGPANKAVRVMSTLVEGSA